MGGRAAEELVFGHFSTGAANDIKQATRIGAAHGVQLRHERARRSDVARRRTIPTSSSAATSSRARTTARRRRRRSTRRCSRILRTLYDEAKQMLAENRPALDRIADALLERETLEGAELKILIEGRSAAAAAGARSRSGRRRRRSGPRRVPGSRSRRRQASRPGARSRLGVDPVQTTAIFPAQCVTIVGVLNATPDSFSDGGRFVHGEARLDLSAALDAAAALRTRRCARARRRGRVDAPGCARRPARDRNRAHGSARRGRREEVRRAHLDRHPQGRRRPRRARRGRDDRQRCVGSAPRSRARHAGRAGRRHADSRPPARRARDDAARARTSTDVLREVGDELARFAGRCAGRPASPPSGSPLDPGLGFGKRLEDNLKLIARIGELRERSACRCWSGPRARRFLGSVDRRTRSARATAPRWRPARLRRSPAPTPCASTTSSGAARAVAVGRALREARREAPA